MDEEDDYDDFGDELENDLASDGDEDAEAGAPGLPTAAPRGVGAGGVGAQPEPSTRMAGGSSLEEPSLRVWQGAGQVTDGNQDSQMTTPGGHAATGAQSSQFGIGLPNNLTPSSAQASNRASQIPGRIPVQVAGPVYNSVPGQTASHAPNQSLGQVASPCPAQSPEELDLEEERARQRQGIFSQMTEDQLNRFEAYRRSSLSRVGMRKLLQAVTGQNSSSVASKNAVILLCGVAKMLVGELVEEARVIAAEQGESGPLRPKHIDAAFQRLDPTRKFLGDRRKRLL